MVAGAPNMLTLTKGARYGERAGAWRHMKRFHAGSIAGLTLALLCASAPAAIAAVINYADGTNNTAPLVLTDNSTQLEVPTGMALQSGAISDGGGGFGFSKTGGGILFLSTENTYSGITAIEGGRLSVGMAGSIPSESAISIGSSGTFDLNGISPKVKSLTGSGRLDGAGLLTITNAVGTFSGAVNNSVAILSGTQIFSGSGTFHSTFTIARDAALAFAGSGSFPGNTVVADGVFDISGTTNGAAIQHLTGGGSVVLGSKTLTLTNLSGTGFSSTFSGVISGTGGLDFSGYGGPEGVRILTGANTYTGITSIGSQSTLQIGAGGVTGSVVGDVVTNGRLVFNRSDSITYSGAISGNGKLAKQGSGTLILTGTNSYSGGATVAAGILQIGAGGTTGSVIGDVDLSETGSLAFSRSDAVTFAGTIYGFGRVEKLGSGTLTLSATNFYNGATMVTSGRLNVTGSIARSAFKIGSGATLGYWNRR